MKITKRQLRRIIREEKARLFETSHEETVDMGGEAWTRDDLLDAISDYSKELTGRRDRAAVEKLSSAPLEDVAAYYADMSDSPEASEMQGQLDSDPGADQSSMHPLEMSPKHQGMGRRTESMKITKRQLRRIIREEKARIVKEDASWGHAESPDAPAAMPQSNGDIKTFTLNLERLIEFGGQDFSDVEVKKAVADALANLGIR